MAKDIKYNNATHKQMVLAERCKLLFEDRGESLYCRMCRYVVHRVLIKEHALKCKHRPWSGIERPICKVFYRNHIIKAKFVYYCILCEMLLDYWDTADDHMKEAHHQLRTQMFGAVVDVPCNNYALLVHHAIVPGRNETIQCLACAEVGLRPSDAKEHYSTPSHKSNLSLFNAWIIAKAETTWGLANRESASVSASVNLSRHNFTLQPSSNAAISGIRDGPENRGDDAAAESPASSREPAPSVHHVEPLNFIVSSASDLCKSIAGNDEQRKRKNARRNGGDGGGGNGKPNLYCVICYAEIPGAIAVTDHLRGKRHREAREKYGCDEIQPIDGEHYFCMSCDRTVTGFANVCRHVASNAHLSGLAGQPPVAAIARDARSSNSSAEATRVPKNDCLACIYVVKQNAKKSFCQICDVAQQFPVATKRINEHVASPRHRDALARYGCDEIVARDDGSYHCRCCERELANVEAVHLHVKDKRHASFLVKVATAVQRDSASVVESTPQPTARPEFHGNFLSGYIARQINESSKRGMICNFTVTPDDEIPSISNDDVVGTTSVVDGFYFGGKETAAREWLSARTRNGKSALAFRDGEERTILEFRAPAKKRYRCNLCDSVYENSTQLHVHTASHYTEEFAVVGRTRRDDETTKTTILDAIPANHPEEIETEETFLANDPGAESSVTSDTPEDSSGRRSRPQTPKKIVDGGKTGAAAAAASKRSWKVADLRKVAQTLDFADDHIYEMADKLRELEFGLTLALPVNASEIYCLVCRKLVRCSLDDYPDHLWSVDHCDYLEEMEADHELFGDFGDQHSDLALANEYMQEISVDTVRCVICEVDVANDDRTLEAHINREIHERKCEDARAEARRCYEEMAPRARCDWYDVKKYWCVACEWNSDNEVNFAGHLRDAAHRKKTKNLGKRMMFDFCASCALLWYGFRCTSSYHSEIRSHNVYKRDGHCVFTDVPVNARRLLASPDEFVDEKIRHYDATSANESAKEALLIGDLERAVTVRFPRARAHPFGSRVSRLGASDSDIDVFLDCRNVYNGNAATRSDLLFFMNGVDKCLSNLPQLWDVEERLSDCRSPIIRASHRATGLSCDISFENGLAVENTKLVKAYNAVFPMCRRITVFLKQWLSDCDLSGSDKITSYALYWWVIFYLQRESILPSVAELIAMRRRSHIVAGWEVGVTYDFTYNEELRDMSLKDFLIRFFTFYADFDYRYDVACPLLGEVVKKRDFLVAACLPKEMQLYKAHMSSPGQPEPLRIDSIMCIQDPFDLQHNLTKAVSKVTLNRFRKCCARSFELLWSSQT